MKDVAKTYFLVAWIVSLVLGILYTITLIGVIFGIPLFVCAKRFKRATKMSDADLITNRKSLLGWGIFLAVILSPTVLGLIIAIVLVILVNSYIEDLEKGDLQAANRSFGATVKEETQKILGNNLEEKLLELDRLKEKGVITEEEYEAKRKQILGIE